MVVFVKNTFICIDDSVIEKVARRRSHSWPPCTPIVTDAASESVDTAEGLEELDPAAMVAESGLEQGGTIQANEKELHSTSIHCAPSTTQAQSEVIPVTVTSLAGERLLSPCQVFRRGCIPQIRDSLRLGIGMSVTFIEQVGSTVRLTDDYLPPPECQSLLLTAALSYDKELCLHLATNKTYLFPAFCDAAKRDKDVVKVAASLSPCLCYAGENVRSDKALVAQVVRTHWRNLAHASPECRDDPDVVRAALARWGGSLYYAGEKCRSDKELVLLAVASDPWAVQFAAPTLLDDKDVMLAAVRRNGNCLQFASEACRADEEIVTHAIANQPSSAKYACCVCADKILDSFDDASAEEALVLYDDLSDVMRRNIRIALKAVERNDLALQLPAMAEFASSIAFLKQAVKANPCSIRHLEPSLAGDALEACPWSFQFANSASKDDKSVALKAVRLDPLNLQYVSEELRDDRDVVSEAVANDGLCLYYAGHECRCDRNLVAVAVRNSGWSLAWADTRLRDEKELVMAALRRHRGCAQFASDRLLQDPEIRNLMHCPQ